jgi:hypothetical protein
MKPRNYLERLRFSIIVEDQTRHDQITPAVLIGLESAGKHELVFNPDQSLNTFTFDETIYSRGTQKLQLHIKDQGKDSYKIGAVKIMDLRIHGFSVNTRLYESTYYPVYDAEYLLDNPTAPAEIRGALLLGNRGTWTYTFETPVHDNESWRVSLV